MAVIDQEQLKRLLDKVSGYNSDEARTAKNSISGHFRDAEQAVREHKALTEALQRQTDAKVDLQVRVRELERELEKRPQPGWQPNIADPNAPFQPIWQPHPNVWGGPVGAIPSDRQWVDSSHQYVDLEEDGRHYCGYVMVPGRNGSPPEICGYYKFEHHDTPENTP